MVYLVYGSPCSGKTTYVKKHLGKNDIICDVDEIYACISNHDSHEADLYIYDTALVLTEYMYQIIKERKNGWDNAYVISTANTKEKLQREMERVGADEAIFINTPYEVCLERAKERPPYFPWLIAEWFSTGDLLE